MGDQYETIDPFDRALGQIIGRNGVTATKPTTSTTHTKMVGRAQTFTVQTFRERHEEVTPKGPRQWTEDTIFITYIDAKGSHRFVIPDEVAATIARQRDALTTKTRKRAARQAAETRKANGFVPTPPPLHTRGRRKKKSKK